MILLTGFEPFGGLARNPSGELARELAGPQVEGVVLPVDYERIRPVLAEMLQQEWDAVILTGVAVGRSHISLERVAINFIDRERPDNAGRVPDQAQVVAGAPAAYFATLPIDTLKPAMAATGVATLVSLTAGAFLCNASSYLALHALRGTPTPCGFIHLPPTPDLACAAPPVAFEEQCRALRVALDRLARADGCP